MKSIKHHIEQLRKELIRHNNLYYDKNNPEISDAEYDKLVKELERLEVENPFFTSLNSPTQKVSGSVSPSFKRVRHSTSIFSLDNTYSRQETAKWYEKIEKKFGNKNLEFAIEPKIDGLSARLTYVDGIISIGATRGDGQIGENVSENIKTIKNIPHKLQIQNPPKLFELCGEVYINKADFEKLNKEIIKSGKQKFANPRNAASGSLRQKFPEITAKRNLSFFVHSFGKIDGEQFQKYSDFLQYCQNCGFNLQEDFKICHSLEEIIKFMDIMLIKRDFLQYETDGLVIKVNSLNLQRELGYTNKSPRWAIAFKFPAKQATTKLNKIRIQVGRTGIITPSAVLEPIVLAGVTISHATLHNFEEIERLNINEGDVVLVERAGDVIPKIIKVVKKDKKDFFKPPYDCPSCKSKIIKENEQEIAYRCINPECPEQFRKHLIHFVSRNAMNIEGFGETVINQFIAKNKIQTLADIYYLTYNDFIKLDLFKEKKAKNLVRAITESKKKPLSKLLFALGIRYIGEKNSEIVAQKFKNIENLFNANLESFIKIPEIGKTIAQSLKDFFENKDVRRVINALAVIGVNMTEPEIQTKNMSFKDKTFVLTGELENYTREQAGQIIKFFGGKITSSITKKTDYVLVGTNAGLKFKKAKELNIKTINEQEFKKLIKNKLFKIST
ncbi:MAG: NAD-dependent DNA ligase LigA [Endomicrobium sp.]|jgi:DNA ligase (NAD+)|nr:NAD-dependent DNA ligase LigA [Endomicrobium sp.]